MNKVKKRLVETMVELVVAKRELHEKKQECKRKKGPAKMRAKEDIRTMKAGLKATKIEAEGLAAQLADEENVI